MLLGGALGNILDRLRDGAVTDFIKLPLGWPPFNLADASITLGIVILFLLVDHQRHAAPVTLFTIAYEDEHLLVVDKGPGLVVHPARGHREVTLAQLLGKSAAGGDPERAGIVHRLDRDTSGLLIVARSEEAHRLLQAALAQTADRARVPGARSGLARRHARERSTPRSGATHVYARAWPIGGAHPREARTHFTLERALSSVPRCCGCVWRRGARTRSASICGRSVTRCAGIRSMEPRACSASSASSCTRLDWRSTIRCGRARRGASRRCPLTSRARCAARIDRRSSPARLAIPAARRTNVRRRSRSAILERQSDRRPVRQRIAALPEGATLNSQPPGPLHPHGNQRYT